MKDLPNQIWDVEEDGVIEEGGDESGSGRWCFGDDTRRE